MKLTKRFDTLKLRVWLALTLRIAKYISKFPMLKEKKKKLYSFQIEQFSNLGLSYFSGKELLDSLCLRVFGKNYSASDGMWSDHLIYFASLSLSGFSPKKILEIGTFKGETTRILSELFPKSEILTIDLSKKEMLNKGIYLYAINAKVDLFKIREKNISTINHITFKEMNSLALTFLSNEFDLIWLDGAHGYPVLSIDFANSLRLLSNSGKLVCDDIYTSIIKEDHNYFSLAGYESLNAFNDAKLIRYSLILKRPEYEFNFWKKHKKYVAIVEKTN